ncbi:unnamed protein product [Rotaria sp. Silwood2]|nr:unnamed protein product [Rotaria sp. Silwood2]
MTYSIFLFVFILIYHLNRSLAENSFLKTQVGVRQDFEEQNTANIVGHDDSITNFSLHSPMNSYDVTTYWSSIRSMIMNTFRLTGSNCVCSYDQLINLLSCSPYSQDPSSDPLSSINKRVINITLTSCNFFSNHLNLPLITKNSIDYLRLHDVNHQGHLIINERSFSSYTINHIYILYEFFFIFLSVSFSSSSNSSSMDNNNNNNLTVDTSSLTMPIIEQNEKLLSSMSSSIPITSSENDEKIVFHNEHEQDNDKIKINRNKNSSHMSNLEHGKKNSSLSQSHSPQTVITTLLDSVITQIETNNDQQLNSLPIIEDDQMEVDDDDDDDDENENDDDDDDIEQGTIQKNSSNKSIKVDKERSTTKTSSSSLSTIISTKRDLKPTTRTLRSHARAKINLSTSMQNSSNTYNNVRRVSSRRRALEKKYLVSNEKEQKRKSISERSKKDKDNTITNDDIHTSSYSDDQTTENTNVEKLSHTTANPNDDASSCSSTGAGDGSSTSSSTINNKQSHTNADLDSLPPNKRRLRERNTGITNTSMPSLTTDASNNSNSTSNTDNSPSESMTTREIPINSIKQFLEIRQQIDKRHETMLNEFVLPKVPKDFSDTTMAKKSYLIASSCSSYSTTTPASIGIKRLLAPHDLDAHLADVFTKQEDERYKMKLRHQVERDKLILSHEQEVLRLCGNATRSSHNQDTPFSYCSLLKDNEVYNDPSKQLPEKFINNDCTNTELNKRGKHRWNGRSFIKWLEDSNLKYKRLSCELNERQRLEADTLYSIQRMVWLKHLPKESANLSSSGRMSSLLTERYLPKVEINPNFWTTWETSPF